MRRKVRLPNEVHFRRRASDGSFHPLANERSAHMFTRVVELTSKSGKAKELANTINEKVVPILKTQRGFVDETVLVADMEPTRVLGLSFWNNREDAERYHHEQYPKIHEMMKHLLETEPNIRTFDVHTSTTHRIVAGKAA